MRSGQPWRLWTLPNAIGYARAALVPVFLVLALRSPDGRDTTATLVIFIAGASDYLDGLAARWTGQFSRLGTLLDPFVDRLLIIAAVAVIYHFELLPRYLMVLVFAREALMLLLSVPVLLRGIEIRVNWIGRIAVWPLMAGIFLALLTDTTAANVLVWIGVAGAYAATALYVKSMHPQLRGPRSARPQPGVEP